MSGELEKAQAEYRAGEFKRAVGTLWEVTFIGDQPETDAREVIALATLLRDETQGGLRGDCEEHIARAERFLSAGTAPRVRGGLQLQQLREEAVRPTKVQTSVLHGADVFMGGDVIDGEETHLYLFRRVDGAAG